MTTGQTICKTAKATRKIRSTQYCFCHAWHGHVRLMFLKNVSPSSSGRECSQVIYADVDPSDSWMRRRPHLVIHADRCLTLTNSMLQMEVSFSSEISTTQVMFKRSSEIFISYSYRFRPHNLPPPQVCNKEQESGYSVVEINLFFMYCPYKIMYFESVEILRTLWHIQHSLWTVPSMQQDNTNTVYEITNYISPLILIYFTKWDEHFCTQTVYNI